MVKVKICGITNQDDADAAVRYGADAIGFVFFPQSPRFISPEKAAAIIRRLPPFLSTVGVFVNERMEEIERISDITGIDLVQLHGDEGPESCRIGRRVIKAIRVKNLDSLAPISGFKEIVSAFLLDTYSKDALGGTGRIFNWDIAVEAKQFGRVVLSGGLTPENISEAIRHVDPYGVDVSSGIESGKGKKDHLRLRHFIENAKSAL